MATALVLLAANDGSGEAPPAAHAPSPTPTSAGPTPLPPSPTPLIRDPFVMEAAPGAMQRDVVQPGETTGKFGYLYFLDLQTGRAEGWGITDPRSQGGPVPAGGVSSDNRFAAVPDRGFITDRHTQRTFRVDPNDAVLVPVHDSEGLLGPREFSSRNGGLLFRIGDGGQFAVVELGEEPRVVRTFDVPAETMRPETRPIAIFAPDGGALALVAHAVVLVDVRTGDVRVLDERPLPGLPLRTLRLETTAEGFLVAARAGSGPTGDTYLAWSSFGWDGRRLAAGESADVMFGDSFHFSPDGTSVAWTTFSAGVPNVVVSDLNGEPRFRVLSATTCDELNGDAGNRWLADSGALSARSRDRVVLIGSRGQLIEVEQEGETGPPLGVHVPAPDVADRLGASRLVLAPDGRTATLSQDGAPAPPVDPETGTRSGVNPWGETSAELRFIAGHLGHGPRCAHWLPGRPVVEFAPFDAYPTVVIEEAGIVESQPAIQRDAGLRGEPAKGAAVIGEITFPAELVVLEMHFVLDASRAFWPGGDYWARVATLDGLEGWIFVRPGGI